MRTVDFNNFKGFDVGGDLIDFRNVKPFERYEMRPVEIHHKADGSIDHQPSFAIVMMSAQRDMLVYGQLTLDMLNNAMESIGYRVIKK